MRARAAKAVRSRRTSEATQSSEVIRANQLVVGVAVVGVAMVHGIVPIADHQDLAER